MEAVLDEGRSLEKSGKLDAAERSYREALAWPEVEAHDRASLHLRLSHVLEETGRTPEALQQARAARKLRPDWDDAEEAVRRLEASAAQPGARKALGKGVVVDAKAAKAKKAERRAEGDVAERLDRVEKTLADLVAKVQAGALHDSREKVASDGAKREEEALRRKVAEMKEMLQKGDAERGELKTRVKELESERDSLREEAKALRAKLEAPK